MISLVVAHQTGRPLAARTSIACAAVVVKVVSWSGWSTILRGRRPALPAPVQP